MNITNLLGQICTLGTKSKQGFRMLEGINRKVIPSRVTMLAQSVEQMGICRPVIVAQINFLPIPGLYVIDGQHLFHALLRLGCDIPYVKMEIKTKEQLVENLALLNNSSKSWTLVDYATVWAYINPDYSKLLKYHSIYDVELSVLANILNKSPRLFVLGSVIKKGTLVIKNEAEAVMILDYLTDILRIIPKRNVHHDNRKMIEAYVQFVMTNPTYSHKKFIKYLTKNLSRLEFANVDEEIYIDFFSKGL